MPDGRWGVGHQVPVPGPQWQDEHNPLDTLWRLHHLTVGALVLRIYQTSVQMESFVQGNLADKFQWNMKRNQWTLFTVDAEHCRQPWRFTYISTVWLGDERLVLRAAIGHLCAAPKSRSPVTKTIASGYKAQLGTGNMASFIWDALWYKGAPDFKRQQERNECKLSPVLILLYWFYV